jgi:hypothetical protein
MKSSKTRRAAWMRVHRLLLAAALALTLAASAVGTVAAGTLTPCLNGAALPGVFGALFGPGLDASGQAHDSQPLGTTISVFALVHSDPEAGDCE